MGGTDCLDHFFLLFEAFFLNAYFLVDIPQLRLGLYIFSIVHCYHLLLGLDFPLDLLDFAANLHKLQVAELVFELLFLGTQLLTPVQTLFGQNLFLVLQTVQFVFLGLHLLVQLDYLGKLLLDLLVSSLQQTDIFLENCLQFEPLDHFIDEQGVDFAVACGLSLQFLGKLRDESENFSKSLTLFLLLQLLQVEKLLYKLPKRVRLGQDASLLQSLGIYVSWERNLLKVFEELFANDLQGLLLLD